MNGETDLPLFDACQLAAMTDGDSALAAEVIAIFLDQFDLWRGGLDPLGAPKLWADTAHTIKGASLSVGALRLAGLSAEIERAGRSSPAPDPVEAKALLAKLSRLMRETADALSEAQGSAPL